MTTRLSLLALSLISASPIAIAQGHNRVERNNSPYLVISTATNATTGRNLIWPSTAPAAFSANPGAVAKGTKVWRHIPAHVNMRDETRTVDGFYVYIWLSSQTLPPAPGYRPTTRFHQVVTFPGATGVADFSGAGTVYTLAGASVTLTSTYTAISTTLATPFTVKQKDIALSWEFMGGENDYVAATPAQPSQATLSTWYDGPTYVPSGSAYVVAMSQGFADPSNTITLNTDGYFITWGSYMENQAVIQGESDWGGRHGLSPVSGYSVGTGYADLGGTAGMVGWDAQDTLHSGAAAVPLLNVGTIFQTSFPIFGVTIELNIGDPALGVLAGAGYVQKLDATGLGDGVRLPIPPLGASAIGQSIGVEYVIVDLVAGKIVDSTQAYWSTIVK